MVAAIKSGRQIRQLVDIFYQLEWDAWQAPTGSVAVHDVSQPTVSQKVSHGMRHASLLENFGGVCMCGHSCMYHCLLLGSCQWQPWGLQFHASRTG